MKIKIFRKCAVCHRPGLLCRGWGYVERRRGGDRRAGQDRRDPAKTATEVFEDSPDSVFHGVPENLRVHFFYLRKLGRRTMNSERRRDVSTQQTGAYVCRSCLLAVRRLTTF